MNSELDKSSKPDPTALPSQTVPVSKGYFELRLRIYYGWLISLSALAVVIYFFLFISTAFSMKHYETYGSNVETQKEWEDTGCYAILQGHKTGYDFEDWQSKQRWKRLLLLDSSTQTVDTQAVFNEPFCLGATVRLLAKTPGPWHYDIVDAKTKSTIVSIVKGK